MFVKPVEGWAGLLRENAKLVASDGAPNDFFFTALDESVAVSGDTVVLGAAGDDVGPNTDQGSAYVFVKPVGGWAGTLTESAKLTASDGAANNHFGFSVDTGGDTVVVGTLVIPTSLPAYVFVEPPGGWAGALHENARLTGSDGLNGFIVAVSGDTVVVAPNVYRKPAGGWAGTLTESARLMTAFAEVDVSGDTAVGGFCGGAESACVFEGLEDTFEAEPAATRTDCKTAGCNIPITCNLSQDCVNRVRLLVRARDVRLREEARAKAPRMIPLASAVASIPPGVTKPVKLKLTTSGRKIVKNNKKRRLQGVIEIRNAIGPGIGTTPITIQLR